jgi:hypothetical protein
MFNIYGYKTVLSGLLIMLLVFTFIPVIFAEEQVNIESVIAPKTTFVDLPTPISVTIENPTNESVLPVVNLVIRRETDEGRVEIVDELLNQSIEISPSNSSSLSTVWNPSEAGDYHIEVSVSNGEVKSSTENVIVVLPSAGQITEKMDKMMLLIISEGDKTRTLIFYGQTFCINN